MGARRRGDGWVRLFLRAFMGAGCELCLCLDEGSNQQFERERQVNTAGTLIGQSTGQVNTQTFTASINWVFASGPY
jgi:hypothetical protein